MLLMPPEDVVYFSVTLKSSCRSLLTYLAAVTIEIVCVKLTIIHQIMYIFVVNIPPPVNLNEFDTFSE